MDNWIRAGSGSRDNHCYGVVRRGVFAFAIIAMLGGNSHAAQFVVTTTADSGAGSLRQAVLDANAAPGNDTVSFELVAGSTIVLTSGQIAIVGDDLLIDGPGRSSLTINGNDQSRIFDVQGGGTVRIHSVTLTRGAAIAGEFEDDAYGGAIRVGITATAQDAQTPGTSRIAGAGPNLVLEQVDITESRAGPIVVNIDGTAGNGGAVSIAGGGRLTIVDSNFANNSAAVWGGALSAIGADLTITGASIFNNLSTFSAAAIYTSGSVVALNHSRITENVSEAADDVPYGTVVLRLSEGVISHSIIRGNEVLGNPVTNPTPDFSWSSGVFLEFPVGPWLVEDSEISDNDAKEGILYANGGGLTCRIGIFPDNPQRLDMRNTTISGNRAGGYLIGRLITTCQTFLSNVTVVNNKGILGSSGVEVTDEFTPNLASLNLESTLIANNDLDLYSLTPVTGSDNLIEVVDKGTDVPIDTLLGVDPVLGPLGENGGPTRTHALLPSSPAIDAGNNLGALAFDQRGAGYPRVVGPTADIGAFEVQALADTIFADGFD